MHRTPSSIYLLNHILCGPSEVLFTLLIFILSKNMNATAFQLMLIACLKPITSLISFYVSSILHGRGHHIRTYLMANIFLGLLPGLLFPFTDNVWFYIASYALFKITERAQSPAWNEYLKNHLELPKKVSEMSRVVSQGISIEYFIGMCLPPLLSFWLDGEFWKVLFVLVSLLQIVNLGNIFFMKEHVQKEVPVIKPQPVKNLIDPLKNSFILLRTNPSFSHYLALYFLGGAGIVMMQPILPIYFNQQLDLSYQELTLAFSFCKGASFLISSPLWARLMPHISLYRLNAYMNLFTCLFIGGVFASLYGVEWLCAGYLCYGTMLGGCELSKNLSGPIFSKKNESTAYSSLNLLLVGVRGCICPFLGFLIFNYAGAPSVFLTTLALCLIGTVYGLWLDTKYARISGVSAPTEIY